MYFKAGKERISDHDIPRASIAQVVRHLLLVPRRDTLGHVEEWQHVSLDPPLIDFARLHRCTIVNPTQTLLGPVHTFGLHSSV